MYAPGTQLARRRFALICAWGIVLMLALLSRPVTRGNAQEATPPPDVPAPEECTVPPRSLEDLQALAATPVAAAAVASPAATPGAVDPATEAAVRAAIRELIACSNAGDFWRVLAVYSDRYVRDYVAQLVEAITGQPGQITAEIYNQFARTRPLPPAARIVILSFGQPEYLPDGRIAVVVIGDDPLDREPAGPTRFILVKQGDRWLIDGFEDVPQDS